MALTKKEIEEIQKKAKIIEQINIKGWFIMLKDKAITWKARVS